MNGGLFDEPGYGVATRWVLSVMGCGMSEALWWDTTLSLWIYTSPVFKTIRVITPRNSRGKLYFPSSDNSIRVYILTGVGSIKQNTIGHDPRFRKKIYTGLILFTMLSFKADLILSFPSQKGTPCILEKLSYSMYNSDCELILLSTKMTV